MTARPPESVDDVGSVRSTASATADGLAVDHLVPDLAIAAARIGVWDLDLRTGLRDWDDRVLALCDALLTQVGTGLEDDVALLALRAHPEVCPRPAGAGRGRDPRQDDVVPGGERR